MRWKGINIILFLSQVPVGVAPEPLCESEIRSEGLACALLCRDAPFGGFLHFPCDTSCPLAMRLRRLCLSPSLPQSPTVWHAAA